MIHDLDFYDLPSEVEGETKGAHHASVEFRSEYSCLVLLSCLGCLGCLGQLFIF